jgi:hypothetical protein
MGLVCVRMCVQIRNFMERVQRHFKATSRSLTAPSLSAIVVEEPPPLQSSWDVLGLLAVRAQLRSHVKHVSCPALYCTVVSCCVGAAQSQCCSALSICALWHHVGALSAASTVTLTSDVRAGHPDVADVDRGVVVDSASTTTQAEAARCCGCCAVHEAAAARRRAR